MEHHIQKDSSVKGSEGVPVTAHRSGFGMNEQIIVDKTGYNRNSQTYDVYRVWVPVGDSRCLVTRLPFQQGDPEEIGLHGLNTETLLGIAVDRLRDIVQNNPDAPMIEPYNTALTSILGGLEALKSRDLHRPASPPDNKADCQGKDKEQLMTSPPTGSAEDNVEAFMQKARETMEGLLKEFAPEPTADQPFTSAEAPPTATAVQQPLIKQHRFQVAKTAKDRAHCDHCGRRASDPVHQKLRRRPLTVAPERN